MPKRKSPESLDNASIDSSAIEERLGERFKLSLQNVEKRFVDLEVAISELGERVESLAEDIKSISVSEGTKEETEEMMQRVEELNQRMEGVEDLIMVEQAGITELKNIMEGVESRLETGGLEKQLENKINEIEQVARNAMERAGKSPEFPKEVKESMGAVVKKTELLEKRVEELKSKSGLGEKGQLEIDELKKNLETLKNKMETARLSIENLKAEKDLKLSEVEKKIESLKKEINRSASGPLFEELKNYKEKIERSNMHVESLEGVIAGLTSDIERIGKSVQQFRGIENVANLRKEVDEKLGSLKFIEDGIRKLSERVENLYGQFGELGTMKSEMDAAKSGLGGLKSELDGLKTELNDMRSGLDHRVEKKDLEGVLKSIEGKPAEFEEKFTRAIEEKSKQVEAETMGKVEDRLNLMKQMASEITKRFDEISNMYKEVRNTPQEVKGLRDEVNGIKSLVGKMSELSKREEGIPKELKVVVNDITSRVSELENSLMNLDVNVNKISQQLEAEGPSKQEAYLKDISDKLVFLESRIAAMEAFFRKSQPIIIE